MSNFLHLVFKLQRMDVNTHIQTDKIFFFVLDSIMTILLNKRLKCFQELHVKSANQNLFTTKILKF